VHIIAYNQFQFSLLEMISKVVVLIVCVYLFHFIKADLSNPLGLRAASNLRGIPFGTAVDVSRLRMNIDDGQYNAHIKNNYELVVPEGELKPRSIWKGENQYYWIDGDFLLGAPNETGWVQQSQMKIRGHNLVWANDKWIPDWLVKNESSITPDKAKQLLSDYIHAVVGRYRGKILCWDVVNEAISDSATKNPFNLRDSFWLRKLGPDFIKYAFQFAHEADPDVQLYYNEYGIEAAGLKANRTIELIKWLRSEGAIVHGIGLQWHINVSYTITPGDAHYQSAQQFIDNDLDLMVTELDVGMLTDGGNPINSEDLEVQGRIYRSMLDYILSFLPRAKAMLTWGFTDRYNFIPIHYDYTKGAGVPLDWLYQPKDAYWQMLDDMTHVTPDAVYRLSPQSQPNKCLGVSQNGSGDAVQLYSDNCEKDYQQWNITWQGDGTYRFSSLINKKRVLGAYNTTATVGGVDVVQWSNDVNQEWAFSSTGNNTYRIVPRTAWWRTMTVYGTDDQIGIVDSRTVPLHDWILTKVEKQ